MQYFTIILGNHAYTGCSEILTIIVCKVKSSLNINLLQVMPSILYLKLLDELWQLLVILTFRALFSHPQIHHMHSIMSAIMSSPVKILLFILDSGGLHAISLHSFWFSSLLTLKHYLKIQTAKKSYPSLSNIWKCTTKSDMLVASISTKKHKDLLLEKQF